MTFEVILRSDSVDTSADLAATRWCEFVVGEMWDGWDSFRLKGDHKDELFKFQHKVHAEQFQKTFCRLHNGYRIVPYDVYRYFWINQFGRDRLNSTFAEKGWTPQVVIPSDVTLHRKRRLDGGRVYFRRRVGWFFEREQDALFFLLFDIDEGHD